MTTRLNLINGALAQLAKIKVANGFNTDIGNLATYWDVYDQDYKGPPTVTLRDADEEIDKVNEYRRVLHLEIEAISYSTEANKLVDSLNLLDDVTKALVREYWAEPGTIIRPTGNTKEIEGKGKQCVRVVLMVDAEYRGDR